MYAHSAKMKKRSVPAPRMMMMRDSGAGGANSFDADECVEEMASIPESYCGRQSFQPIVAQVRPHLLGYMDNDVLDVDAFVKNFCYFVLFMLLFSRFKTASSAPRFQSLANPPSLPTIMSTRFDLI